MKTGNEKGIKSGKRKDGTKMMTILCWGTHGLNVNIYEKITKLIGTIFVTITSLYLIIIKVIIKSESCEM